MLNDTSTSVVLEAVAVIDAPAIEDVTVICVKPLPLLVGAVTLQSAVPVVSPMILEDRIDSVPVSLSWWAVTRVYHKTA